MFSPWLVEAPTKVDVRLPGKGNSNSLGARPVHLIITMIKWIRTNRLLIKNSLCVEVFHIHYPREVAQIVLWNFSVHKEF